MSARTPADDDQADSGKRPTIAWILVGLIAAALGIFAMLFAGASNAPDESTQQAEDTVPLVETAPVQAAPETYLVHAPGRLMPRQELQVVGEVAGKVVEINPNLEVGGRIARGELVLRIDPGDYQADLERARAQRATARARLSQATSERDRQVRLAEIGAAPEKAAEAAVATFEDAQAAVEQANAQVTVAERSVQKTVIRAPFDAIVTSESVSPGTFVSPGSPLARLINAGVGELSAGLPAEDVAAVRAALAAAPDGRLEARAVPNDSSLGTVALDGYVEDFSPNIDPASRTASIIAVFPNAFASANRGNVFAEDFMTLEVRGRSDKPVWQVPTGAVRQDSFLWIVRDGEASRVDVTPLDRRDNSVLLTSEALSGGERVMTTVLAEEIDGMRVRTEEAAP